MRPRSPGAGNARELAVMKVLAEEGWLCASRRHIGGAGDVLAVRYAGDVLAVRYTSKTFTPFKRVNTVAMLIEVKSTTRSAWVSFLPADRQAMVETAERYGAEPWLYWWPPRGQLQRIPASDWPISRAKVQGEVEV